MAGWAPVSAFSSVDLPAPEGPTTATRLPPGTAKLTPSISTLPSLSAKEMLLATNALSWSVSSTRTPALLAKLVRPTVSRSPGVSSACWTSRPLTWVPLRAWALRTRKFGP
ncbi:Uncharacterised protein [Mycobacteroides abscessus subsp. abscessus]|nr:Uncharacterised protein [Mycobacteroides abscessus subsp. abscessus]